MGRQILAGEAKAVKKGFPPMVNPSAADVAHCLDVFQQRYRLAAPAMQKYADLQLEMKTLRARVQQAARGLAATLRVLLAGEESATKRRAMRGYGFRFRDDAAPPEQPQAREELHRQPPANEPTTAAPERNTPTQTVEEEAANPSPRQKPGEMPQERPRPGQVHTYDHRWITSPQQAQAG